MKALGEYGISVGMDATHSSGTKTALLSRLQPQKIGVLPYRQERYAVEFPVDFLKPFWSRAVRRVAPHVEITGFRKGKAPEPLVIKHFSKSVGDALKELLVDKLKELFVAEGVGTCVRASFENWEDHGLPLEKNLNVKCDIALEAQFELKPYRGIPLPKDLIEIANITKEKSTNLSPQSAEEEDGSNNNIEKEITKTEELTSAEHMKEQQEKFERKTRALAKLTEKISQHFSSQYNFEVPVGMMAQQLLWLVLHESNMYTHSYETLKDISLNILSEAMEMGENLKPEVSALLKTAEEKARLQAIFLAIANQEKITISEAEWRVGWEISRIVEQNKLSRGKPNIYSFVLHQDYGDHLQANMLQKQVVDFLISQAEVS